MTVVRFDNTSERFPKKNGQKTIKKMVVNDDSRFIVTIMDREPKNHPSQKEKASTRTKVKSANSTTSLKIFTADDDNDEPYK